MSLTNEDIQHLLHENAQQKQKLIEGCQQGDRRAFNQCILEYQSSIFNHVSQMVENKEHAQTIAKNTFVEAFRSFPAFHGTTSLDVWLLKIAQHQIECSQKGKQSWYRRILSRFQTHSSSKSRQEDGPHEHMDISQTTSTCSKIESLFVPYIDRELSESESKEVEEHLTECEACRKELEDLRHADDFLHVHSMTKVPSELRVQINAAIDELQENRMLPFWQKLAARFPVSGGQVAAVAASIALVFAALTYRVQYQQLNMLQQSFRQTRAVIQQEPSIEHSETNVAIVTGKTSPEQMSLQDARFVAGISSDPEKTETLFIPGDITFLGQHFEERITAMHWELREDAIEQEQGFIVRRMLVEIPESSLSSFFQFLQILQDEEEDQESAAQVPTTRLRIYLLSKQDG